MIEITKDNWEEEVMNSDIPVMIDFWAPWCGPCKIVGPVFEKVSKDYKDKVKFVKVNVDDNENISAEFGIRSIPTFVLISNKTVREQAMGAISDSKIRSMADRMLNLP